MLRTEAMGDRRLNRHLSNEGRASITLHKKLVENKRVVLKQNNGNHQIPDLTDFMNDMFFGTINNVVDHKKSYNLTGGGDEEDFDSSTRSVSSKQTQEWLQKAKLMVSSSPPRGAVSPSRLVGSPRFGISQGRFSTSSGMDKRDPLSRSARRHRAIEGFSGEILSKTAKHTRNISETNVDPPSTESSPQSDVQKWFSNGLKIPTPNSDPTTSPEPTPPSPTSPKGAPPLPLRQSMLRKSRFQTDPTAPLSQPIPTPTTLPSNSKRTFKTPTTSNNASVTILDNQLLSPPKHLIESAHRRSISSNTCSVPAAEVLSPPRNLVESARRRSISSSTCRTDRILEKDNVDDGQLKGGEIKGQDLNGFLKEQRVKIGKILCGEINGKAKIVLSGPSNSTSSMVAAICYAWLLENRMSANKKVVVGKSSDSEFVVPVMNIRRGRMWNQRQAAWLFHHVNLDANALLFSNEVDLETLMMAKQLSMLVVGEDILRTNGEVGSACTILTDNYCEDAYDLLQTPILKKLMLAGILLDTQNLNNSPKMSMTRDAEAVQLLSVGSAPNYRNTLFDQLMQDQRDNIFFEVLCHTYGKPPSDCNWDNGTATDRKISDQKNTVNEVFAPNEDRNETKDATKAKKFSPSPGKPSTPLIQPPEKAQAKAVEPPRGKNKNFFAKLFGFGSK